GCAVIPGLINAHTHLYQNFLKGISPNITLVPWCNEVLFPTVGAIQEAFSKGNRQPAYLWGASSALEMIHGGITCAVNMDVTSNECMSAHKDAGFRSVMAFTLSNRWVPAELRKSEAETRLKTLDFVNTWHEPDGITQVFLAPSTLFLCTDDLLGWARDRAEDLDLGIQIHISEIASEVAESIRDWGIKPVERLRKLGLLSSRLSAVHCVHIDPDEIKMLAEKDVRVVHCPKSNMKLADGAAPVTSMMKSGLKVGLGTDGCGSNDLLDMWEEMRAALLLARVTNNDASTLTCRDVFRMATEHNAAVANIQAGKIEPGLLADLAIVELNGAHLRPFHPDHALETLVWCTRASDVRDTIINGQTVMRNRIVTRIDEEEILSQADQMEAPLYARRTAFRLTAEN
ncbi:MAG: amidohydrolase, partial [Chloroflexi bacterium]